MKIALFTETYLPQMDGVVSYLSGAIKLLSRNNEVLLFAPGEGPLEIEQVSKKIRIYRMPSTPLPFYKGYRITAMKYRTISRILEKEKPGIVHAHAPVVLGCQGLTAAKRKNLPTVITHHTHFPDYTTHHMFYGRLPGPLNKLNVFTVKKIIKYVYTNANVVIAPTKELVEVLRTYGVNNAIYLPNGVDLKRFKKEPAKETEFRKLYGIPKNKKIVLYLGRISSEKRLDCLLKAFKRIEKNDMLLLLVGVGQHLKKFRKLAKNLGIENVLFTGFVKDEYLNAAYGCADMFVSPSDTETFGLTFVEAMQMGLPTIGVSRLGAREIVDNDKTGILVEPGDVEALAAAIKRLFEDDRLRKRMGRNARKRAKKYSLEKNVKKTLDLYKKMIRKKVGKST